ncbi:hypothetical protein KQI41_05325 [Tissierella pigra]|uniref:Uncharacterized protein n=1 Tax=Tissierella pigra TaxID=2607614 RepID=A0A6N7XVW9_9FIRM|nr:hypothetical protein [Tissierella pigra]MBU5425829.1 hypothetical protein [Tissierella pigra]MSU01593.1 hypothetical protein [Tissierella pigra]
MKSLNKRKQSLSSAREIANACACSRHPCHCYPTFDAHIDSSESLYAASRNMSVRGVEPTSINKI